MDDAKRIAKWLRETDYPEIRDNGLKEAADLIDDLVARVAFLEQHLDIVVESLLAQIDKECLPKFEEARKTIMNMRESTARKG